MLEPVTTHSENWYFCWTRGWIALDQDNGAYLMGSNGIGKYGSQIYWLIVKGKQDDLLALAKADYIYRKRITVNPWGTTQQGVIEIANEYLRKWLDKQGAEK